MTIIQIETFGPINEFASFFESLLFFASRIASDLILSSLGTFAPSSMIIHSWRTSIKSLDASERPFNPLGLMIPFIIVDFMKFIPIEYANLHELGDIQVIHVLTVGLKQSPNGS